MHRSEPVVVLINAQMHRSEPVVILINAPIDVLTCYYFFRRNTQNIKLEYNNNRIVKIKAQTNTLSS